MPYYKEKNILFIHIPKTGGTVIENQLKTKFKQSLYGGIIRTSPYNGGSPQHLFYKTIFEHKEKDVKGLKRTHRAGEHYPNSGFPFSKICPNKTQ